MRKFFDALAILTIWVASQVALSTTGAAAAENSGQAGADRWSTSVAFISGITIQVWDANAASVVCRGCTIPDPLMGEEPLRPSISGDDTDVTPFVGGSIELMSPEFSVPGSPRLFVGAEVMGAFGIDRKPAREGQPGTIESPVPEEFQDVAPFGDDVAIGQGSEITATMSNVMYGAYAGIAFPLEFYERPIRIKASVAWIRYEVDIEGLVVDASCLASGRFTECNPNLGGFLRETRLTTKSTEAFNGIGPGIDLELDTGRMGPLGTSIFMGARFYRILGDRKVKLSAGPEQFDDILGQDSAAARFNFEVDEWMYRVGIGFRMQWLGFDG
jgi:hypothetical protein